MSRATRPLPAIGSAWKAKDQDWDRRTVTVTGVDGESVSFEVTNLDELLKQKRRPNSPVRMMASSFRNAFVPVNA